MTENQATCNTPEAFIETWDTMQSMVTDLNALQELPRDKSEDDKKVQNLCRKYPFLESTREEPGLGNPYWKLKARLRIWIDAVVISEQLQTTENARPDLDAFHEFESKFSTGKYTFLWEPPFLALENLFLLYYYAYDAFWTFIQNMNPPGLQEQEKQDLGRWVAWEIEDTLIHYELIPIYTSREEEGLEWDEFAVKDDLVDEKDFAYAKEIVRWRIERGDWRIPGPYRFGFNGI